MIEGLSHITFVVKDLERTAHFLNTVFGAREVYSTDGDTFSISKEKFFLIDGMWFAIMEGEPLAEKTYNHVALKVPDAEFDKYEKRVRSLGVEVIKGRSRIAGEGKSVYFFDYDNHLFELHTASLEQRLNTYKKKKL